MSASKRTEILNMISHELKTPTVPIIGYCEMLLNPKFGKLNDNQKDAINEIMKNIQQTQKLLDEVILQHKQSEDLEKTGQLIPRELRTPLVPILGYCEMLLNPKFGTLDNDQKEAVIEIQQNSIKLSNLISDFWNAQQLDLGEMKYLFEEIDVDEFVEEQMNVLSELMNEKSIEFTKSVESGLKIKGDRAKLEEVMRSLVENAVVFVPDTDGKISISVNSKNEFVEFAVEDNGIGIPKGKMDTLFKKFHQMDTSHTRSHGGSGLGLVICKGYVEGMRGKVYLQSEQDKGTTFFFTIPKAG